jgi:hypothetical protein
MARIDGSFQQGYASPSVRAEKDSGFSLHAGGEVARVAQAPGQEEEVVRFNMFDIGMAPPLPQDIFSRAVRGLADGVGHVVGEVFGIRESSEASRRAPMLVHELRQRGVEVGPEGDIAIPDTAEGGAKFADLVILSHGPGDLSLYPGLNGLQRFRDPTVLEEAGFSDAFIQGFLDKADEHVRAAGFTALGAFWGLAGGVAGGRNSSPYRALNDAVNRPNGPPERTDLSNHAGTTVDLQRSPDGVYRAQQPNAGAATRTPQVEIAPRNPAGSAQMTQPPSGPTLGAGTLAGGAASPARGEGSLATPSATSTGQISTDQAPAAGSGSASPTQASPTQASPTQAGSSQIGAPDESPSVEELRAAAARANKLETLQDVSVDSGPYDWEGTGNVAEQFNAANAGTGNIAIRVPVDRNFGEIGSSREVALIAGSAFAVANQIAAMKASGHVPEDFDIAGAARQVGADFDEALQAEANLRANAIAVANPITLGGTSTYVQPDRSAAIAAAHAYNQASSGAGNIAVPLDINRTVSSGETSATGVSNEVWVGPPDQLARFVETMTAQGRLAGNPDLGQLLRNAGIDGSFPERLRATHDLRAAQAEAQDPATLFGSSVGVFASAADAQRAAVEFNGAPDPADHLRLYAPLTRPITGPSGDEGSEGTTGTAHAVFQAPAEYLRGFFDAMQEQGRIPEDISFDQLLRLSGIEQTFATRTAAQGAQHPTLTQANEQQSGHAADVFSQKIHPLLTLGEHRSWEDYAQRFPDIVDLVQRAGIDASPAAAAAAVRALIGGAYAQDVVARLRDGSGGTEAPEVAPLTTATDTGRDAGDLPAVLDRVAQLAREEWDGGLSQLTLPELSQMTQVLRSAVTSDDPEAAWRRDEIVGALGDIETATGLAPDPLLGVDLADPAALVTFVRGRAAEEWDGGLRNIPRADLDRMAMTLDNAVRSQPEELAFIREDIRSALAAVRDAGGRAFPTPVRQGDAGYETMPRPVDFGLPAAEYTFIGEDSRGEPVWRGADGRNVGPFSTEPSGDLANPVTEAPVKPKFPFNPTAPGALAPLDLYRLPSFEGTPVERAPATEATDASDASELTEAQRDFVEATISYIRDVLRIDFRAGLNFNLADPVTRLPMTRASAVIGVDTIRELNNNKSEILEAARTGDHRTLLDIFSKAIGVGARLGEAIHEPQVVRQIIAGLFGARGAGMNSAFQWKATTLEQEAEKAFVGEPSPFVFTPKERMGGVDVSEPGFAQVRGRLSWNVTPVEPVEGEPAPTDIFGSTVGEKYRVEVDTPIDKTMFELYTPRISLGPIESPSAEYREELANGLVIPAGALVPAEMVDIFDRAIGNGLIQMRFQVPYEKDQRDRDLLADEIALALSGFSSILDGLQLENVEAHYEPGLRARVSAPPGREIDGRRTIDANFLPMENLANWMVSVVTDGEVALPGARAVNSEADPAARFAPDALHGYRDKVRIKLSVGPRLNLGDIARISPAIYYVRESRPDAATQLMRSNEEASLTFENAVGEKREVPVPTWIAMMVGRWVEPGRIEAFLGVNPLPAGGIVVPPAGTESLRGYLMSRWREGSEEVRAAIADFMAEHMGGAEPAIADNATLYPNVKDALIRLLHRIAEPLPAIDGDDRAIEGDR